MRSGGGASHRLPSGAPPARKLPGRYCTEASREPPCFIRVQSVAKTRAAPVRGGVAPGRRKGSSLPRERTVLPREQSPLPRESGPLSSERSPLPRERSPLPRRSSPLPRERTPLPWEGGHLPQENARKPGSISSFIGKTAEPRAILSHPPAPEPGRAALRSGSPPLRKGEGARGEEMNLETECNAKTPGRKGAGEKLGIERSALGRSAAFRPQKRTRASRLPNALLRSNLLRRERRAPLLRGRTKARAGASGPHSSDWHRAWVVASSPSGCFPY